MPVLETKGAISAQGFGSTLGPSEPPIYIEDVFNTWLYNGVGPSSGVAVNNGIDLLGKGGMVWTKPRSTSSSHATFDTSRGVNNYIMPNQSLAQNGLGSASDLLSSFNSNGFTLGTDSSLGLVNSSPQTYVAWTFREQPKFFDVVTYTGNGNTGSGQQIAHNLGSTPGCIIIKSTSGTGSWLVYHRGTPSAGGAGPGAIFLNTTSVASATNSAIGFTNATVFSVGENTATVSANTNGVNYVAYLFAHNAGGFGLSGTDNVISCGSSDGSPVNLGWEPQWLLYRSANFTDDWHMIDNMRGAFTSANPSANNWRELDANVSNAETSDTGSSGNPNILFSATGFTLGAIAGTAIYIAIRRGPMKVPTTGTSVFDPENATDTEGQGIVKTTNFPVDLQITKSRASSGNNWTVDRLRGVSTTNTDTGPSVLITNEADAQYVDTFAITRAWNNTGFQISGAIGNSSQIYWNFRRAPSFFDEVCYTGNGTAGVARNHNLGVVPELTIIKIRNAVESWIVIYGTTATTYNRLLLQTNDSAAVGMTYSAGFDFSAQPTATTFTPGGNFANTNQSGRAYVAYFFATCPGVSKVGTFTGTGATQVINCGFTGGARFVLIRATSTTGDWLVWDSARGIVAGNDPYLRLNSTASEVTGTDWVDTAASGFELSNSGGNLANSSGVTYIFLAIA